MRVIVATIAKDEEKFVERWARSALDADLLAIGDTGSTDETIEAAVRQGVAVHELAIRPWRFDDARNALMALLPDWEDAFVITLDMDEVLTPGWREALEKAHEANPQTQQFRYDYTWSWVEGHEGETPDVMFDGVRCHSRYGWRWKGPVHEVLTWGGSEVDPPSIHAGFGIEHYDDDTKPRSSYLPLLELAVREEPENPRQAFYLGREYYFRGMWNKARAELMRFLELPRATWPPERAAAWRLLAKMDDYPERWLLKAVSEDPKRREVWVALADHYAGCGMHDEAAGAAARALRITERPGDYLTEAHAWDDGRLRRMAAPPPVV